MWWLKTFNRAARVAPALALAALVAGCFQPMYGERSPGVPSELNNALSSVDVRQIEAPNGTPLARVGVEVRNNLLFNLTGGGASSAPTHKLDIRLSSSTQSVIVDIYTARPDIQNYGIDATYVLTDLSTGKRVFTSQTFARVSFDTPGQQQRFVGARALRDAEDRASKVIADQIRSRLASYFVAGT